MTDRKVVLSVLSVLSVCSVLFPGPTSGQIDPSGAWRTWHTPHFRVHARAAEETTALRAAAEAERAYAALAAELTPPRGTIDLTLHDNVDFANGFASIVPSNRIAIYPVPPAGSVLFGRYDDWLRLVITHELFHLFHLDRTRGVWRVAQRIFGRLPGTFPNTYQPAWVSEGLATYYESKLTTAGRVRGGLQPQLLAAATAGGWPRPADATLASPAWPAGFRPYAWGSFYFTRVARESGDSVVPRFVERTAGQWWPYGVSGALRRAGGGAVGDGWEGMRGEWATTARTEVGPGERRLLARGLRAEPRARLSPDGARLAYVHADGRTEARVVVLDRATGTAVAQHRVNSGVDLAWVNDRELVVAQLEYRNAVEVRTALYRWDLAGSWRLIPGSGRLARPFSAGRTGLGAVDVASDGAVVLSLGADGTRMPLATPVGVEWARVDVTSDGAWLAGAVHDGHQWDIVVWPAADPGRATPVTADAPIDADPRWNGDGTELLFTSERRGLPQVFAWRRADGATRQLTDELAGARDGAVTPDGRLVYAAMLPDGYAVAERLADRAGRGPDVGALLMSPSARAAATPPVSTRRTGYAPWPSLRPHFWVPTWHDAGTAGRFLGAFVAGSDPVGRTAYVAHLAAATGPRLEGVVALNHARWKAAGVDASYRVEWSPRRAVVQQTGDTVPLALREQFATTGLTLRWRRWRSAVSVRVGGELEFEALANDSPLSLQLASRPDYLNGVISVSAYRAAQPPLAISPEDGASLGLLYRRRAELGGTGWSQEARGAANGYVALPLPGFAHWVLAGRVAGGVSTGPNRAFFDLGGESGDLWGLLPGYAVGGGRRQFPLRGYDEFGGFDRVAAAVVELRVPIALLARGLWKLPLGVDRISLAAFAEAARARFVTGVEGSYEDVGAEAVLDMAVSYDIPLRVRLGGAVPLTPGLFSAPREPRWYLTFGSAF